MINLA
ncbi:hypothetical protein AVEN_24099-1, partial [Araneus ventricosus]|jgi:hypothetical protein